MVKKHQIDPYHLAAMLSLGGIKICFRTASLGQTQIQRRLAVQKQSFYSSETQHGCCVIKVYCKSRGGGLNFPDL